MSILNLIFVLSFMFGMKEEAAANSKIDNPCELQATVQSTEIGDSFQVEVTTTNNTKDVEYFFFNKKRNLINVDSHDNKIRISQKGEYFCIVVQDNKCHIKIDFKL